MSIEKTPTAGTMGTEDDLGVSKIASFYAPADRDAQIEALRSEVRHLSVIVSSLSARLDMLSHRA